jgi:hypothetical protein
LLHQRPSCTHLTLLARTAFLLFGRARCIAVGAKHTAILALWPEEHTAVRTPVEEQTRISGHFFSLCKVALRAGNNRLHLHRYSFGNCSKSGFLQYRDEKLQTLCRDAALVVQVHHGRRGCFFEHYALVKRG